MQMVAGRGALERALGGVGKGWFANIVKVSVDKACNFSNEAQLIGLRV
jgi:hypothetical protein